MGEKGIGRLAIALLGRQVLVLTRAKRDGHLHEMLHEMGDFSLEISLTDPR